MLGREKNIIDVVGQKVNPLEVENVLRRHPDVIDSIVIAVPDPDGNGQSVAAYVVGNSSCVVEDLRAFCRERLANYKVPQSIAFISDVPKNALGKALRDRASIERVLVE